MLRHATTLLLAFVGLMSIVSWILPDFMRIQSYKNPVSVTHIYQDVWRPDHGDLLNATLIDAKVLHHLRIIQEKQDLYRSSFQAQLDQSAIMVERLSNYFKGLELAYLKMAEKADTPTISSGCARFNDLEQQYRLKNREVEDFIYQSNRKFGELLERSLGTCEAEPDLSHLLDPIVVSVEKLSAKIDGIRPKTIGSKPRYPVDIPPAREVMNWAEGWILGKASSQEWWDADELTTNTRYIMTLLCPEEFDGKKGEFSDTRGRLKSCMARRRYLMNQRGLLSSIPMRWGRTVMRILIAIEDLQGIAMSGGFGWWLAFNVTLVVRMVVMFVRSAFRRRAKRSKRERKEPDTLSRSAPPTAPTPPTPPTPAPPPSPRHSVRSTPTAADLQRQKGRLRKAKASRPSPATADSPPTVDERSIDKKHMIAMWDEKFAPTDTPKKNARDENFAKQFSEVMQQLVQARKD